MSKTPIFKKERNIYWPAEFSPVADLLIGKSENGETNPNRFFQMYVQVLVLAACIGVSNKRKREVGSGPKKEVSTQIFYSNKLDEYLLLIPMLANPDQGQEILKPENDDFLIREFESYAAGGLEILNGIFNESPGKLPELIMQNQLLSILKKEPDKNGSTKPDIFSI
jgi:dnd system-associated protein 4